METHFATIWEALADTIGGQEAVVQHGIRHTWSEHEQRSARLAGFLADAGIGVGSKVAMYLFNSPAYLETHFAALKLRAVPVNVNYRYLENELAYLLENSDSEAVVYHSSLGAQIDKVRGRLPLVKAWIEVRDDDTRTDGSFAYDELIAQASPAPRITRSPDALAVSLRWPASASPSGRITPRFKG